jgi:hypothetical protein
MSSSSGEDEGLGGWESEPDSSVPQLDQAHVIPKEELPTDRLIPPPAEDYIPLHVRERTAPRDAPSRKSVLESLPWARSVLSFFAQQRDRLGPQLSKVVLASGCTGMFSEGMVAEVLCNARCLIGVRVGVI